MEQPALALIELNSIAVGATAADAMVKKAPIEIIQVGTIQRGKYLILIGGAVAAVEESFDEAIRVGGDAVVDKVMLPAVHPTVRDAILGKRQKGKYDALGVIETANVAPVIDAADAGVKGAEVRIMEIRLGDGLGGKGMALFTGKIHDVEAAVEIGVARIRDRRIWIQQTVIPVLHEDMIRKIGDSTRFRPQRQKG
ncbi:MAG: BMC domain-containing protein [Candidatus Eisenbacteria sp.]|nr:BMC domain-containing protein [Candidatus Eisenbacteria bacterium]